MNCPICESPADKSTTDARRFICGARAYENDENIIALLSPACVYIKGLKDAGDKMYNYINSQKLWQLNCVDDWKKAKEAKP